MNRRDFLTGLAAGAGYALTAGGILEPIRRFWQVPRNAPFPPRYDGFIQIGDQQYVHEVHARVGKADVAELDPAMRFNTGEAEIAKNIEVILLDPSRVDAHGDVASREAIADAAARFKLPPAPEGLEFAESYIDADGRWVAKIRVVDGKVFDRLRGVVSVGGGISVSIDSKVWALDGA